MKSAECVKNLLDRYQKIADGEIVNASASEEEILKNRESARRILE